MYTEEKRKESFKDKLELEQIIFTPFWDRIEAYADDLKREVKKSRNKVPAFDADGIRACAQFILFECEQAKLAEDKYENWTLAQYNEVLAAERHDVIMRLNQDDYDNSARRSGVEPEATR